MKLPGAFRVLIREYLSIISNKPHYSFQACNGELIIVIFQPWPGLKSRVLIGLNDNSTKYEFDSVQQQWDGCQKYARRC